MFRITFFAAPDFALQHRKKRHHGHHGHHGHLLDRAKAFLDGTGDFDTLSLAEISSEIDALDSIADEPDKEKWKEILRKIVAAILKYHTIPHTMTSSALARNYTYPTELKLPKALDGQPQRLNIVESALSRRWFINFYARSIKSDVKAKNGELYVVPHFSVSQTNTRHYTCGEPSFTAPAFSLPIGIPFSGLFLVRG